MSADAPMVSNGGNTTNDDLERARLLEEIRRRAEEEELKRLEEDESDEDEPSALAVDGVPDLPSPPPPPGPLPRSPESDLLWERLRIALERGLAASAADILVRLRRLDPDDPELDEYARIIEGMRTAPPPPPAPPPPAPAELDGMTRRNIAELLDRAQESYQHERYDRALKTLDEVLGIAPGYEDAVRLREDVVRSRDLAEVIRQEEQKQRALEGVPRRESVSPNVGKTDAEIWGSAGTIPTGDSEVLTINTDAAPVPPRPSAVSRMRERLKDVEIPWKPILIGAGVLVLVFIAYMVVDELVNAVVPPQHELLVILPSSEGTLANNPVFGPGLHEDLVRDLSIVPDLRTMGAVTASALGASGLQPRQQARVAGAEFFLTWVLEGGGDRVRWEVRLYDTTSSGAVWSAQYTTSLREVAAQRQELAGSLLAAMDVAAPDDHGMSVRKVPTGYAESYEAYLAGRSILRGGDPARLPEAVAAFGQATTYDSTFADAHAALAWSQMLLMEVLKGRERSLVPRALNSVNRAILLGSRNPETYRAWSMVEHYTRGFDKAVERLEEAVRIAPSDGESYRRLALAQLIRGRGDLAQVAAGKALEIDPSNPLMVRTIGQVSQFNGQFAVAQKYYARLVRLTREESIEALDLATDILVYLQKHDDAILLATDRVARTRNDPMAHYRLGRLLQTAGRSRQEWLGPLDRSQALLEEQFRQSPGSPWIMSQLSLVQTRRGMFKEALDLAKQSMERMPVEPEVLYNISRMYALQRDRNRSLDLLRQAVGGHYLLSQILDMDYFTLRTDPGFISAVTR